MDTKNVERIAIEHWMNGPLSIARHSGGCRVNGVVYLVDPRTNELVREDVVKREAKERRAAKKALADQTKP